MSKNIYTADAIGKVLPQKLKTFRKNSGLTTAQVGHALNKTPSAVTLWETGKALPDVYVLLKLCEIYHVADLNEFLDTDSSCEFNSLTKSEQEVINLWRKLPSSTKASIKTILKECNKQ
ncbi:helix-turn-helix transcriptional regulator [bacterium]|nr:helix-turn-helix transcriptional regulator [bacterium]